MPNCSQKAINEAIRNLNDLKKDSEWAHQVIDALKEGKKWIDISRLIKSGTAR